MKPKYTFFNFPRNAHIIRKLGRKRPLRRPRCRWEDNVRVDLKEIGWEGVA
jgi:hypothetical protein